MLNGGIALKHKKKKTNEKKKKQRNFFSFFRKKNKKKEKSPKRKELNTHKFTASFLSLQTLFNPIIKELQKLPVKSKNTNEDVNTLTKINTILSKRKNKKKDIADAIKYLTKNKHFLKILQAMIEFEYDDDKKGKNYNHHLNNLKNFLLKYIQYFPSDKLCCEAMREIFKRQNLGALLIMPDPEKPNENPYLEEFIKVGITKKKPEFLELIWLTTDNDLLALFNEILKQQKQQNPNTFTTMLMPNEAFKAGCKNFIKSFNI
jgi:hypothetical protein